MNRNVPPPPPSDPPVVPPPIPVQLVQDRPITIERTSKRWKKKMIQGWLCTMLGLVFAFVVSGAQDGTARTDWLIPWIQAGVALVFVGLARVVYAHIGAWWENG